MRHQNTPVSSLAAVHVEDLIGLVYELLDAHSDTVRLARGPTTGLRWRIHLNYVRDPQRTGHEILARAVNQ